MLIFEKIAENKIREAIANGDFDNLQGEGKTLDLSDYFTTPPAMRLTYHIMKNAGILPQEVLLMKEIADLKSKLNSSSDESEIESLHHQIGLKTTELNILKEQYRKPSRSF